jgi:hypothetical protein
MLIKINSSEKSIEEWTSIIVWARLKERPLWWKPESWMNLTQFLHSSLSARFSLFLESIVPVWPFNNRNIVRISNSERMWRLWQYDSLIAPSSYNQHLLQTMTTRDSFHPHLTLASENEIHCNGSWKRDLYFSWSLRTLQTAHIGQMTINFWRIIDSANCSIGLTSQHISSFDFDFFAKLKHQLMSQSIHDQHELFDRVAKLLDSISANELWCMFHNWIERNKQSIQIRVDEIC